MECPVPPMGERQHHASRWVHPESTDDGKTIAEPFTHRLSSCPVPRRRTSWETSSMWSGNHAPESTPHDAGREAARARWMNLWMGDEKIDAIGTEGIAVHAHSPRDLDHRIPPEQTPLPIQTCWSSQSSRHVWPVSWLFSSGRMRGNEPLDRRDIRLSPINHRLGLHKYRMVPGPASESKSRTGNRLLRIPIKELRRYSRPAARPPFSTFPTEVVRSAQITFRPTTCQKTTNQPTDRPTGQLARVIVEENLERIRIHRPPRIRRQPSNQEDFRLWSALSPIKLNGHKSPSQPTENFSTRSPHHRPTLW